METKLEYGMKLMIAVNPIEFTLGGIGVSSSNSEKVWTEFIVDKYWDSDTDPMAYKVKCVPVDKSGRFGNEKFYSSDLILMIESGKSVKIVK